MKKTTTRLATVAAVLIMSAFAIILAQVDARKRDRSAEPQPLVYSGEAPESPLQIDVAWPEQGSVVRASQEQLKEQLITVAWEEASTIDDAIQVASAERVFRLSDDQADQEEQLWNQKDSEFDQPAVMPVSGEAVAMPVSFPQSGSAPSTFPSLPAANSVPTSQPNITPMPSGLPTPSGLSAPGSPSEIPGLPPALPAASWPAGSLPSSSLPSSSLPTPTPPTATLPTASLPQMSLPSSALLGESTGQNTDGLRGNNPQTASQFSSSSRGDDSLRQGVLPQTQQPIQNEPQSARGFQIPQAQAPSEAAMASTDFRGEGSAASRNQSSPLAAAIPGNEIGLPAANGPQVTGTRAALVSNQPGSRFLDGSQNPIMQIQKRAPEEIQVGKKATFIITVRNAGSATAHDVTVVDRVPRGSRFAEALPSATPTADGTLVWNLGEMAAGDERSISIQIIPEVEGEVGSVASVHFTAQASVRTVATLPQLALHVESNGSTMIGQSQQVVVTIENTGSGVARGVRLEADIPEQLRHESGEAQLEALVGDLRPGESRRLTLNVAAVQAGQSQCLLRALNDDGIKTEKVSLVDVRAPQLSASISGPSLRYLERQANYKISVANNGTAMARNLDFAVHLPVGLKFVSVDIPQATYNPQSHSISLGLAELDAGQSAPFTVTVLPVQAGSQVIRFNANADLGIAADAKAQVTVAGLAELAFTIGQDNGTVEIGASTTYAVQVTNVGNQPDKNVLLQVQLPEGSKLLQVDSPVEYRIEGSRVSFAPLAEMRSRDVQTFRLQVQHNQPGNQVVRTQLTSENWPVAVVKEEGTLVYDDRY